MSSTRGPSRSKTELDWLTSISASLGKSRQGSLRTAPVSAEMLQQDSGVAAQVQQVNGETVIVAAIAHAQPELMARAVPSAPPLSANEPDDDGNTDWSDDESATPTSGTPHVLWRVAHAGCCDKTEGSLMLIDDGRVLDHKMRREHSVCCCLTASVHTRHVRIPVDEITRMEALYGQAAAVHRLIFAGGLAVLALTAFIYAPDQSNYELLLNWAGGALLMLAGGSFVSYLNSMEGGMTVAFWSTGDPIRARFMAKAGVSVGDADFGNSQAMGAIEAVQAARAKWHTSGAV